MLVIDSLLKSTRHRKLVPASNAHLRSYLFFAVCSKPQVIIYRRTLVVNDLFCTFREILFKLMVKYAV